MTIHHSLSDRTVTCDATGLDARCHGEALAQDGATFVPAAQMQCVLDERTWKDVAEAWDHLPRDRYTMTIERYRRYGRLLAHNCERQYRITPRSPAPFRQPADVMPLHAGRDRIFAEIPQSLLTSPALLSLIDHDLMLIDACGEQPHDWAIGLHAIRIATRPRTATPPAPEGRHRDGHSYIAMHLIQRCECIGGLSRVYKGDASVPDLAITLRAVLDTVIVNDEIMEHEVTQVQAIGSYGCRDMLIVDFERIEQPDASSREWQAALA